MKKEYGFTLIELMVTIAISGILVATAVPFYQVYRQRAYGLEATIMGKQIIDAQITYFLENDRFYPGVGDEIKIWHDGSGASEDGINNVKNNLKIEIRIGHNLNFTLKNIGDSFWVIIDAANNIPLFKGGTTTLIKKVTKDGYIETLTG